jgi:micrococcal nuclease
MRRRLLPIAVLVAAALLLLRPLVFHAPSGGARIPARVVRAVDGDTLVASAGGRSFYVRLLGIDTPETHRPGTPVECGGPDASAAMRALAFPGERVELQTDPGQDRLDRYGRLLAYVWLADGRLIEDQQLRAGWATTYVFRGKPVRLFGRLAAAERVARQARRGVWGKCRGNFHRARDGTSF